MENQEVLQVTTILFRYTAITRYRLCIVVLYKPLHIYLSIYVGYHVGDLGNIKSDENGEANIDMDLAYDDHPSLYCAHTSITERSFVIHESKTRKLYLL